MAVCRESLGTATLKALSHKPETLNPGFKKKPGTFLDIFHKAPTSRLRRPGVLDAQAVAKGPINNHKKAWNLSTVDKGSAFEALPALSPTALAERPKLGLGFLYLGSQSLLFQGLHHITQGS